jgi:hypothetical protein
MIIAALHDTSLPQTMNDKPICFMMSRSILAVGFGLGGHFNINVASFA